ncbi:MAG: DUF951 domain-containing protein [Bacillota bacterium]|nr:DUF951 domain-containing protein [Bacillota bacterium]MDI7248953.1 DUF951 domain-containing protein [Bacillota bacterium]
MIRYHVGDVVRLRKAHPCGSDRWEITRTGIDFGLRCLGCGRYVMIPRRRFERSVKELLGPSPGAQIPAP